MYTKEFQGQQISVLGMGNMRLPTLGEEPTAPIDYEKAAEIIDYAMKHGITYYDTAYVYNGSEAFLGTVLPNYDRSSFQLATKYNAMASSDYRAVFEEQLQRLNTDYIDFYLLHAIMSEESVDNYINSGAVDYFLEQKMLGRIRKIGFSSHASIAALEKMADYCQWDFAQIQMNYLDWTMQDAKGQYEVLTKRNIPVVVMEPVRGGRLAALSPGADALLKEAHPDWSIASWAFRWLMRLPNVQVILSGMSTMDQIIDNVKTFETFSPLGEGDAALLERACEMFRWEISVPCTACRYCIDNCPMGIDIPKCMELYNQYKLDGSRGLRAMEALKAGPADCIGCGNCQKHCPQSIGIPAVMTELAEAAKHIPGPPPAKKD